MADSLTLGWNIFEIVWINILLSGDNAIMIALACRGLPERRRRLGVVFFGAVSAVVLRIAFTLFVVNLLGVPYLKNLWRLARHFDRDKAPLQRGRQR